MSSPQDQSELEHSAPANKHSRPPRHPTSRPRPLAILASLSGLPENSKHDPVSPTSQLRPMDILRLWKNRGPPDIVQSTTLQDPNVIHPRPHALLEELGAHNPMPSTSSSTPRPRPMDILAALNHPPPAAAQFSQTGSTTPPIPLNLRPIAPLPKRALPSLASSATDPIGTASHLARPSKMPDAVMNPLPNFLDLTMESSRSPSPIVDVPDSNSLPESDVEIISNPDIEMATMPANDPADFNLRPVDFVFNTNIPVNPRHTVRPWVGTLRPQDWVPSREELHAQQVDLDRSLPLRMHRSGFPIYAISPSDLESMHTYLMARYQVTDFDDYKHLLGLLRNTRAISAHKALSRHADLRHLQNNIQHTRSQLIRQLKEGRRVA